AQQVDVFVVDGLDAGGDQRILLGPAGLLGADLLRRCSLHCHKSGSLLTRSVVLPARFVHTGQLSPMGQLAYAYPREPELPEMSARSSVCGVPIAQSYRTGVAGQAL